jgi:hypothetical protein
MILQSLKYGGGDKCMRYTINIFNIKILIMSSWIRHGIQRKSKIHINNTAELNDVESSNNTIGIQSQIMHPDNYINPTFHILIATGGRPSLKGMLDSLKNELYENDAITIVFDGKQALTKSTYSESWTKEHKCKIHIVEQIPNLGFWGHGIRNKYQGILETKTTFILNADDDDIYIPGSFDKLRHLCSNSSTLYIARFEFKTKNIIVPSQMHHIIQDDIGTPCGIIPFDIAHKSVWESRYGGDFDYYNNLKKHCKSIKFLNIIIYSVT